MDYAIQKATELGVTGITPVLTEYCDIKPNKIKHWEKVVISACEQSGRTVLPTLNNITKIHELENI